MGSLSVGGRGCSGGGTMKLKGLVVIFVTIEGLQVETLHMTNSI